MSDIKSIPVSELPEGDARRALAEDLKAGRVTLEKEVVARPTVIKAGGRFLTCAEWLAEYTARANAGLIGGEAA